MINIIKANTNDLRKIAELAEIIWTEYYTPLLGAEQVRYMLDNFQSYEAMLNSGYQYYFAADDIMCGYCGIDPANDEIFLSKLYIHKDYRGKKIARGFLDRLLTDYPNCKKIWLTVNKHNADTIAAYKKMGFTITDEKVADIGGGYFMDDYIMTMKLSLR